MQDHVINLIICFSFYLVTAQTYRFSLYVVISIDKSMSPEISLEH